ncbi:inter-alpha-trypsin inhibitor heavy chain H3-like [Littorina saxatilis]|uniref:inter-alpha-trypsin inhibitor heavy chain H3-like n=1 Tax=Littorina saxatilis TaxID=31220 RepID=UPI0038B5D98C
MELKNQYILPAFKRFVPVLLLCFCTCASYGSKLKSSGTHLLAIQDQSASLQLQSAGPAPLQRHQRDVSGSVEIKQFHVSSKLYSRFATVKMESEVLNQAQEGSKEVSFQVQVPEAAFMSNFSMVVDGQVHMAQVLEKEAAQQRYDQAKAKNQTAGQVKQSPLKPQRGMELFTINVNLAPRGTAFFTIVYNELLERRAGTYRQRLMIQPGSVVANMSVRVYFAERQGFKYFAYKLPGSDAELISSSAADQTQMMAKPDSRELVFRPTVEMQRSFDADRGIHGEFIVLYSVNNEPAGGSIIVQNDYFAHFFAPPGLAPLPKNILFIIDISGSMSGEKIEQAKEAMLKILDDLKKQESDTFNILLFDDGLEAWADSPMSTLGREIDKAKGFVRVKLESRGGTNIHFALMEGLRILLKDREEKSCKFADIIVFLTDGDPTTGVTDTAQIIREVTTENRGRSSIFSLGFGFNMNYAFLSKLSDLNRGFARRIYAEKDANDQLRNFYEEISTPVLCDVAARYSRDVVDTPLLTFTTFPLFFEGREIIVAGKTKMAGGTGLDSLDAELHATGAEGAMDFVVPVGKVEVLSHPEVEDDLTEKLWAYMKIKSLLKSMETLSSEAEKNTTREQALNMSLTYSFVTPLTSFSIVVEKYEPVDSLKDYSNLVGRGSSQRKSGRGDIVYHNPREDTASFSSASVTSLPWVLMTMTILVAL